MLGRLKNGSIQHSIVELEKHESLLYSNEFRFLFLLTRNSVSVSRLVRHGHVPSSFSATHKYTHFYFYKDTLLLSLSASLYIERFLHENFHSYWSTYYYMDINYTYLSFTTPKIKSLFGLSYLHIKYIYTSALSVGRFLYNVLVQ